jgi:hypothetical protein
MSEYSSEYLALMKEGNERGHVYVIGGFSIEMSDHVPGQLKLAFESARKLNKNYVLFFIDSSGGCSAPSRPT